jgi:ornithine carbamoyltransferase
MHKDFLAISDYGRDELEHLLDLAEDIKSNRDKYSTSLKGKTLGMIFHKASTRTRVSFETGIYQMGGIGYYYGENQLQIGRGELISDTAQVLSRYLDAILIRTFSHSNVLSLAKFATIPVINGLTDYNHPCQALADLLTIWEKLKRIKGLTMTYIGDGNNMAASLLAACVTMDMNFNIVCPEKYNLTHEVWTRWEKKAIEQGVSIKMTPNLEDGVQGANIVYTDVWASMGQEEEQQVRLHEFKNYQVTNKVMKMADKDAIFMHCLPAHRGEEVSEDVIDGPQSIVFDQAENRLHAQKAIMYYLMKECQENK